VSSVLKTSAGTTSYAEAEPGKGCVLRARIWRKFSCWRPFRVSRSASTGSIRLQGIKKLQTRPHVLQKSEAGLRLNADAGDNGKPGVGRRIPQYCLHHRGQSSGGCARSQWSSVHKNPTSRSAG